MSRLRLLLLSALLVLACAGGEEPSRVLVLGLDGLDPQTVDLLMSEGRMPSFAKLRQEGAYGRLLSQEPLLSPIIWTTIATGKTPDQHGIGHFVAVSQTTGESLPVTSRMRRVKALWNVASDAGREVAVVGWWATWPPETVNGAVVSDHTAYHFLFEDGFDGGAASDRTYPPELFARLAPLLRRPADVTPEDLAPFVDVTPEEVARPFDFKDELAHFRWALATAESYRDVGLELWRTDRPDLAMVYVEGTDSTSHLFGHLFRAEGLAGELREQQRKYGRTVEEIYGFADRLLGRFIDAMDERTTLVVLSDHGFELGALHDDPSKTRDLRRVSERFHRLEGILYLYGHRVKAGARLERATILDVAPTVLTLLGLPAAADMPGRPLAEAFVDLPVPERVASYEGPGGGAPDAAPDDAVSQAQLEHLKSLGYLGGDAPGDATSSPQGDRTLAAIHFQAGRYREAAAVYQRLAAESPDDAALRASLAGVLGALGRYDLALAELDRSIELEPLNVEAYHNRAVIHERQGRPDAAIADYERALRYSPRYEPSRAALSRLTGRVDVRSPRDAAEAEAARLVEEASVAARRADYAEAMRLLDAAQTAAPAYVLIYQYRSNVAYLMGDRAAAVAALERALELEPDNALFQQNLEQLQ
jgi:tetratricopeptide (TPR) repeat protein